ncbi:MAG: transcription-repair coupling factor [Planctomycetes bacterium]|nr:transcription-repair coupling factor [Planctomycetota bacterium]
MAFSLCVAAAAQATSRLLVVTPGPETAELIQLDLEALAPAQTALVAPLIDDNSPDKPAAWVTLLARLHGGARVLLAPSASLLDALPAPDEIRESNLVLAPGTKLKPESLFNRLVESGMQREEQIDGPGQFARRGGIVDIYPATRSNPVRLELLGPEIESVRAFDVETQRSFESLPDGVAFPLVALSGEKTTGLLDHMGVHATLVIEPDQVHERIATLLSFSEDKARHERARRVESLLATRDVRRLRSATTVNSIKCVNPINLGEGYAGVAQLIGALRQGGNRTLLFCGAESELRPAREGLAGQGVTEDDSLVLLRGDVGAGRVLPEQHTAVMSIHELLGRGLRRMHVETPARHIGDVFDDFVDLEPGDYVVHLQHGIARFKAIETLKREGKPGEFLALEFAEGTTLHVPATNADVVQKYIGMRGEVPPLSKLNTAAWSERKLKASQSVLKLAAEMLELNALRAHEAGYACRPDGPDMAEYEAACPFRDTPDQATSSIAIKRDMESLKPMDRLLCGDVGYGKTELAMRAAFKMVLEGKQVAMLVPTTVLAQQHWLSFRERLRSFPVSVDLLSRFRTPLEAREVIEKLAEGKVDIVIGTHRLLSNDVQFKNLGLVIIDEEQRFGVEHKEKLKQMRRTVDLLTLSATPIPRTLHQALLGLRDISNLTTPPQNRMPILTRLCHWSDRELQDAMRSELARDGQVFFVHNRVFDIDVIAERVRRLVPEARIEIGHGQMPERQLEEVMVRFMAREIDVLVCTTIIESGIDVRNANTMIINNAQNFGLSELHQLRGRVGRYHHQAHCYLMVPDDISLSEIATKRLKAILQYQALGSGFKIAMRDLELRGAGSLLGAEQSGHIATIGYDLYCRLLDRAVKKLRNQPVPPEVDTQLDFGLSLELPREYIPGQKQRLEIYRRLARIQEADGAEALLREIADRFGKPPREIERMVTAALVRSRLARLGVISISRGEGHLKLRALSATQTHKKLKEATASFRVLDETWLALPLRKGLEAPEDQLRYLHNLLQTMATRKLL